MQFTIYEYGRAWWRNTVEIPEHAIKEIFEEFKKTGDAPEEFESYLRDCISDIKWDYIDDREMTDEDVDESEYGDDYEDAITETVKAFEKSLCKLGEFGNE